MTNDSIFNRELLIDEFIRHCSDLFPYDDPQYEEKLMRSAENYADEILNPNSYLNSLCKEHDELLNDIEL